MVNSEPRIEARANGQFGRGWSVHVTWPSGTADVITGFETEYQALNWITFKSANWVADQVMRGRG